jgi:hypothetical protein
MALKRSASRRDVIQMNKLAAAGMTNARIAKRLQMDVAIVNNFIGADDSENVVSERTKIPGDQPDTFPEIVEEDAPAELSPQQKAAITRKLNAEKAAAENAE